MNRIILKSGSIVDLDEMVGMEKFTGRPPANCWEAPPESPSPPWRITFRNGHQTFLTDASAAEVRAAVDAVNELQRRSMRFEGIERPNAYADSVLRAQRAGRELRGTDLLGPGRPGGGAGDPV